LHSVCSQICAQRGAVRVALLIAIIALPGCAQRVAFNTELSDRDGLSTGYPVTLNGTKVGTVVAITPLLSGKSAVSFAVDKPYAGQVHIDSIAVLRASDVPPSLELMTPNSSSPAASPGAVLAGAANRSEETALLGGPSSLGDIIDDLARTLGSINAGVATASRSAQWNSFQQSLLEVERQSAAAGAQGRTIVERQMPRLERQFADLQQQLIQNGNSDEARHLRAEMDRLSRMIATPPSP
jgi:ABC-type transporter Mla subunit MlaD